MPSAELGTMNGIAGLGAALVSTTVLASGALTVIPAIKKDGFPLRLATRLSEKTTSAEVTGVPSEKTASLRSLNV